LCASSPRRRDRAIATVSRQIDRGNGEEHRAGQRDGDQRDNEDRGDDRSECHGGQQAREERRELDEREARSAAS
jgi:hypothetical protein